MVHSFFGKKLGMTQIFSGNKVVPVTVVDVSNWFVLGNKTQEKDGYNAVVIGLARKRFQGQPFSPEWLKKLKDHFSMVREVKSAVLNEEVAVGQRATFHEKFSEGALVDVVGTSKGCGFAGVVRRHGFVGAPASHGSKMGNRPGSIGFMCKCGRVIKGKKLPGHMGFQRKTVQNLELVKVINDSQVVLIKGAVPGKAGSLVFVQSGVKA